VHFFKQNSRNPTGEECKSLITSVVACAEKLKEAKAYFKSHGCSFTKDTSPEFKAEFERVLFVSFLFIFQEGLYYPFKKVREGDFPIAEMKDVAVGCILLKNPEAKVSSSKSARLIYM
jgi:hypothetical protein